MLSIPFAFIGTALIVIIVIVALAVCGLVMLFGKITGRH